MIKNRVVIYFGKDDLRRWRIYRNYRIVAESTETYKGTYRCRRAVESFIKSFAAGCWEITVAPKT